MQFTCDRTQLLSALTELQTVVKSNATIPILTCVLLNTNSTELVLTGTNTTLTLYLTIPCISKEDGIVLVSHALLTEWLRHTTGEVVKFTLKDTKLSVTVNNSKCTLAIYPVLDYPTNGTVADALANDVAIELPLELEHALRLTAVATLDDASDPRAHLHALTFIFSNNKLSIYATDSFRLALQELNIDVELNSVFMLLVQGVQTNLLSLFKQIEPATTIKFYNASNQAIFQITCKKFSAILALQKVDGKHINITGLIPATNEVELFIDRVALVAALQGAQVFGKSNHDRVYLTFTASTNTLVLSSIGDQVGTYENSLPIRDMVGADNIYLILNAKYLLEYLKVSSAQEILISKRVNERSPLILRDTEQLNQGLYLVMPINEKSV